MPNKMIVFLVKNNEQFKIGNVWSIIQGLAHGTLC